MVCVCVFVCVTARTAFLEVGAFTTNLSDFAFHYVFAWRRREFYYEGACVCVHVFWWRTYKDAGDVSDDFGAPVAFGLKINKIHNHIRTKAYTIMARKGLKRFLPNCQTDEFLAPLLLLLLLLKLLLLLRLEVLKYFESAL